MRRMKIPCPAVRGDAVVLGHNPRGEGDPRLLVFVPSSRPLRICLINSCPVPSVRADFAPRSCLLLPAPATAAPGAPAGRWTGTAFSESRHGDVFRKFAPSSSALTAWEAPNQHRRAPAEPVSSLPRDQISRVDPPQAPQKSRLHLARSKTERSSTARGPCAPPCLTAATSQHPGTCHEGWHKGRQRR